MTIKMFISKIVRISKFTFDLKTLEQYNIIIGASSTTQIGWAPSDQKVIDLLDEKTWLRFFSNRKVDKLLAEHVLEHLDIDQCEKALRNCFKYLKSGGRMRAAVPDGFFPDKNYIEYVKPGGHGPGSDDHKVLFNYKTFSELFQRAGFKVELLEYFDENGNFHESPWDPEFGFILRSRHNDDRNTPEHIKYTSIILDAFKP